MKDYKNNLAVLAGNILDHYDTHIYVLLAPFIAQSFFANDSVLSGIIKTHGIGLIGIISRPFGAIFFGYLATSLGPLRALRYSLVGVAVSTFLIGLLPGFADIGNLAPLLLLFLRMLQGVFAAGEGAIAGFYLISTNKNNRSFFSTAYGLSTLLGIFLASKVAHLISLSQKPELYWRLGFLLGFVTSLSAVYIRQIRYQFNTVVKVKPLYIMSFCLANKGIIGRIMLLCGFSYLSYPLAFTMPNSLWPAISDIQISTALETYTLLVIFDGMVTVLAGYLLKFVKVEKFIPICAVILMFFEILLLVLITNASFAQINCLRLCVITFGVVFSLALKIWIANITDDYGNEKYLLNSVGGSIGMELLGRSFLPCSLYIFYNFSNFNLCICYVGLLGFSAIYAITVHKQQK